MVRFTETESGMAVARKWGGRREWGICVQWVQSFNFTRPRVLWMGGGDGSAPMLNVLNASLKNG